MLNAKEAHNILEDVKRKQEKALSSYTTESVGYTRGTLDGVFEGVFNTFAIPSQIRRFKRRHRKFNETISIEGRRKRNITRWELIERTRYFYSSTIASIATEGILVTGAIGLAIEKRNPIYAAAILVPNLVSLVYETYRKR